MRVHVVGLPHTQTTKAFDWCAYTGKIRRFGTMLHMQGHEMILYSGDENEAICTEHISVTNPEKWFDGRWPLDKVFDRWDMTDPCWTEMNTITIGEIQRRIQPGDIVGIIAGLCQKTIADHFSSQGYPIAEWGIGYEGILDQSYRAFESHAWQHYVYGFHRQNDGRYYDAVIPNAFDIEDFTFHKEHDGYLLFLGRHTYKKGLSVVAELAKHYKVITAGQGEVRIPGAEYVGVVLGEEKAELLSRAQAVLVPTDYIEPFGGVAVEAMLSGAPAITTNWGAFPETVNQGISGYRCNTLQEYIRAVEDAENLDRETVRNWAQKFTTTAVSAQYDQWLQRLESLRGDGWYSEDL